MSFQQEAVREWVYNVGSYYPEREWLLSDYDSWEKNPHFKGTPGRHPEDDCEEEVLSEMIMPPYTWQDECPF